MNNMLIIESNNLIIKRGTYEDYLKVYEYDFTKLRNTNGEFEYIKNSVDKIKEYSDYHNNEKNNIYDFIIYLKDDMTPIGNIILDKNDIFNSLEIAFNMHPNYWHNGYMYEAILKIIDYIFNNTKYISITCGYAYDNYKSKKLCEKLGFKIYNEYYEFYPRFNKDIKYIQTILNKENN